MSDAKILMLSPTHQANLVPGAVEVVADCGHPCWISPTGLMVKLSGGVVTRCQDCIEPSEVSRIEGLPGAAEELGALMGQRLAGRVLAAAKSDPARMVRVLHSQSGSRRRRRK